MKINLNCLKRSNENSVAEEKYKNITTLLSKVCTLKKFLYNTTEAQLFKRGKTSCKGDRFCSSITCTFRRILLALFFLYNLTI